MNATNSKRVPLWKLFGKLRSLIVVAPEANAPHRSWDRAASREIQLELDFDLRGKQGRVSKVILHDPRGMEKTKSWGANSVN